MANVLDLFAGAGGFSLGFKLAGYKIIGGIEIDKWAGETFAYNHNDAKVIIEDITRLSDDFIEGSFKSNVPNIIIGGPPCQGFSVCVKNACDPKDPRNSLFTEFLRVVKRFNPELVVMENVPNLVKAKTTSNEFVISIIKKELEKIGYNVYYDVLEATDYGVPQIRRRLFLIGSKHELERPFPKPTHYFPKVDMKLDTQLKLCPTLWDAISDLPDIEAGEGKEEMDYDKDAENDYQSEMRGNSPKVYNHVAMKHSKRMVQRFASMSWGESTSDVPNHLLPLKRNGHGKISEKVYDQNNRRMHPKKPCHTIPASFYANFVHPYKNRNFTAREGARIQSFPDSYVFKGKPTVVSHKLLQREGRLAEKYLCQYNQIGNAVPPLVAKAIAQNLHIQLEGLI
jgi:DNA (cytosine-5)-methyltransferase 1